MTALITLSKRPLEFTNADENYKIAKGNLKGRSVLLIDSSYNNRKEFRAGSMLGDYCSQVVALSLVIIMMFASLGIVYVVERTINSLPKMVQIAMGAGFIWMIYKIIK